MAPPTRTTVLNAVSYFKRVGEKAFLDEFATGHAPREYYFRFGSATVPLKALWAAAHTPAILTGPFTTLQARRGLRRLGFEPDLPNRSNDALHDLGSDLVDTRFKSATTFMRDERVRRAVLKRATGRCEYCGLIGFKTINGRPYLESHHIIRLADDGKDKLSNVIALCPNDHRKAHFSAEADRMEEEMTAIVAAKEARRIKRNSD